MLPVIDDLIQEPGEYLVSNTNGGKMDAKKKYRGKIGKVIMTYAQDMEDELRTAKILYVAELRTAAAIRTLQCAPVLKWMIRHCRTSLDTRI